MYQVGLWVIPLAIMVGLASIYLIYTIIRAEKL